jgi:hypothetical protein
MRKIILFAGMVLFLGITFCFAQEQLTITTYYPSPYGSYNSLQTDKLGVGDNNNDGSLTSADVPTTSGDVWIHGNVGIGTTNPSSKLEISSEDYNGLTLRDSENGNIVVATLEDGVNGATGSRGLFRLYDQGVIDVQLLAGADGTVSYIKDGDVGIGTTSPGAKLEVAGGGVRIKETVGTAGSVDMFVAVGNATSRTGTALCESSLGANDVDAVCLGHWTSALVESTCATSLANSRALCVIVGD